MKLLTTLLVLFPFLLAAQSWELNQEEFITSLVELRSQVMMENTESINYLHQLEKKWGGIDTNDEKFKEVLSLIITGKHLSRVSDAMILETIKSHDFLHGFGDKIKIEDLDVIASCTELLDLVVDDVLRSEYPYALKPNSSIYEELLFYQFDLNDKIGEIGAGRGTFSLILGVLNKNFVITSNELDSGYINYMNNRLTKYAGLLNIENMSLIQGDNNNTHFEKGAYDKIVIRNSYHHFSKRKEMLSSIKSALKPTGVLLINEQNKGQNTAGNQCHSAIKLRKIKRTIKKAGFKLEKTQILGARVLLKFYLAD